MRMKRILAAIAILIASVVCSVSVTTSTAAAEGWGGEVRLRVATYNIQAGAGMDRLFDVARTAEAIRGLGADVVGLQEVDVHWSARSQWRDLATELAELLDMQVFFAPIYSLEPLEPGLPRREFGNAVLSRYPIRYAQNHQITRLSTQVPNPVPELAPGFPEVVIKVRGIPVHVYATHLDYRADPTVREMQVADMLRIMDRWSGRRQVLLGDLNARPDAAELGPLWVELADAWAVANPSEPGLTFPASLPDRRIDYVTVNARVQVRAASVVQSLASDHLPVVADLAMRRGRTR
jgi:endonuclease/exonuclease/phosphatase family metal-dependent hydrolase